MEDFRQTSFFSFFLSFFLSCLSQILQYLRASTNVRGDKCSRVQRFDFGDFAVGDFGHVIEVPPWSCDFAYIYSLHQQLESEIIDYCSQIIVLLLFSHQRIMYSFQQYQSFLVFLLLFLTKSTYIASTIRKRYTRLLFSPIVVTYIGSLIKVK